MKKGGDFKVFCGENLKVLFILSALSFIFYFNIIFQKNYFFGDFMYQYYPWRSFLATSLRQGVIPHWNPYALGGMPFIGDIQNAVFYPLNWVLAFFVNGGMLSYYVLELHLILHLILGGFFMFIFAREIKISFPGAIFTAISFSFGGFLVTKASQVTLLCTFVYLPLIFYFLHKSINERNLNYAIYGGVTFAISFLAGGSQYSIHILYFVLAYCLFLIFTKYKHRWHRQIIFALTLVIIGVGISAIQILPTLEFSAHTVRKTMTYTESIRDSLPLSQLLTLLIPKLFGSFTGAMETDTVPYWGESGFTHSYWETWIYLGILPLLLIFFAYRDTSRKNFFIFLSISAIVSLLAAMGKYTPVYWFIYHLLPGFNKFRIPGRFAGLFTFTSLILAGIGFDEIFIKRIKEIPKALYVFLGIYVILLVLLILGVFEGVNSYTVKPPVYANMIKQSLISLTLILTSIFLIYIFTLKKNITKKLVLLPSLIIFIDLFFIGHNFNHGKEKPYQFYRHRHGRVKFLQKNYKREIFRVNTRKEDWILMPRNAGNVFGLELLQGYNPLRMKNFSDIDVLPLKTKLDLFNTKYTIQLDSVEAEKTIYVNMVLNDGYLPRALMFFDWTVVSEKEKILDLLQSPDFDYRKRLILQRKPYIEKSQTPAIANLKITRQGYNQMEIFVETIIPGILFVSELYYPAWKAYMDESPVKTLRANYAFRAIPIPKGRHIVKMKYQSRAYQLGQIISIITLIGAVLLLTKRYHRIL